MDKSAETQALVCVENIAINEYTVDSYCHPQNRRKTCSVIHRRAENAITICRRSKAQKRGTFEKKLLLKEVKEE